MVANFLIVVCVKLNNKYVYANLEYLSRLIN